MTSIKDLFQYSHFSVNQWNEDEGTQTHHKIFDHLGNAMNYVINVVDKGETLCR